jgi:hypothetical protein
VRTKSNVLLDRRYSHPVDKSTGVKWTPLSRPLFAGNKLMPAEVWV